MDAAGKPVISGTPRTVTISYEDLYNQYTDTGVTLPDELEGRVLSATPKYQRRAAWGTTVWRPLRMRELAQGRTGRTSPEIPFWRAMHAFWRFAECD